MEFFHEAVFFKFLAAILALVNPLIGLPIFLSMTEGYSPAQRRWTAVVVMLTVAFTGLISVLAGEEMLAIFGIDVASFRVAGGVIILGIGLAMLHSDEPRAGDSKAIAHGHEKKQSIAVVPLSIPLTIGPGAIVTSIVFAHQLDDRSELFTLAPAILIVAVIMGAVLLFAAPISKALGPIVINVLTRIMAIILTAIAVEMVLTGVADAIDQRYPGLATSPSTG